jgi:GT2 family glycosyltransferase
VADLTFVIVNWNVRDLLRRCLLSLPSAGTRGLDVEVIVVDNDSLDGSQEMVRTEFPGVRLITNKLNLGFSHACNQGWEAGRGRHILFLNPDTEVGSDTPVVMVRYMDAYPDVGALGPRLRYPDGSVQSSRRRFPTLATAFFESTLLELCWPRNPWALQYRLADRADDVVQEVDWVVGACLLVRHEVLEEIGGFDEGYFMYSEELDLCRRIWTAGWKVVFLPEAEVIHHEGKSSEQVVAARHIHFQTSKVRYFRKHHGRLAAGTLRAFLMATYAYQIVEEALKWLVGHRRKLRAARLQAYWRVFRSRLRPAEEVV